MALVLIVDDDAGFRALLEAALTELGHEVFMASDGAEGLDAARAHPPHMIISDIMMPGMDGVEFNAHLQLDQRTKGIPVLMLTGDTGKQIEVSVNSGPSLHFEYIIGKNAPLEKIMSMCAEILSRYYQL